MNEHALIQKYFIPLAKPFPGAFSLSDDAAVLEVPAGMQLVVTKDAIAEGVHYLPGTDPALIARKLLRTNLSDLAAMGATPWCYFLSLASPSLEEAFIARFAEGLAADQQEFLLHLAGGDTIRAAANVFSITAHGLVPDGSALRRNGAKAGDVVCVSGTLGDAALGLVRAQGAGGRGQEEDFLVQRYHLPQPRLALGEALRGLATSCMDISDGLLADMGHICVASGVGAELELERLPISDAARAMLADHPDLLPLIYSGGDDYELLFTLPADVQIPEACTAIGRVSSESGVRLFKDGKIVPVEKTGYAH